VTGKPFGRVSPPRNGAPEAGPAWGRRPICDELLARQSAIHQTTPHLNSISTHLLHHQYCQVIWPGLPIPATRLFATTAIDDRYEPPSRPGIYPRPNRPTSPSPAEVHHRLRQPSNTRVRAASDPPALRAVNPPALRTLRIDQTHHRHHEALLRRRMSHVFLPLRGQPANDMPRSSTTPRNPHCSSARRTNSATFRGLPELNMATS
jgi:hypothetical protein